MKDQAELKPGVYHGKRRVKKLPIFNHEYTVVVPKNPDRLDGKTKKKLRVVGGKKALVVGGYNRKGRLKTGVSDTTDVQAAKADPKHMRLISDKGSNAATKKAVKAAKSFKPRDYPSVLRNVLGRGVNSNSVARSLVEETTGKKVRKGFKRTPGGNHRVEFSRKEKRDGLAKVRDIAIIGGGAGVAAGGVASGVAAVKAARSVKQVTRKAGDALDRVDSKRIAKHVTDSAKGNIKKAFPTAVKVGKALTKRLFHTPAQQILFSSQQIKSSKDHTYAKTMRVASGLEDGYYKNAQGKRVDVTGKDIGMNHAQVLRGAYGTGKKIQRSAGRGSRLVRDVSAVAKGKDRDRDQAGRKKKREWEKSWFKNAAGSAAATAGVLAYYTGVKKSPMMKAKHIQATNAISKGVNSIVPGAVRFSTPAQEIIEFDDQAARAGWDVRDARGKSARVFAPGSRRRVRRQKEWHEKKDNERKLWKAGLVGAAALGVVGGSVAATKIANKRSGKAIAKAAKKVRATSVNNPKNPQSTLVKKRRKLGASDKDKVLRPKFA